MHKVEKKEKKDEEKDKWDVTRKKMKREEKREREMREKKRKEKGKGKGKGKEPWRAHDESDCFNLSFSLVKMENAMVYAIEPTSSIKGRISQEEEKG